MHLYIIYMTPTSKSIVYSNIYIKESSSTKKEKRYKSV